MIAYLDVNCVIYLVERNPQWWAKVTARISALRAAGTDLAISDLTLAECLVGPYTTGDASVLGSYQSFFTKGDLHIFRITPSACDRAARIRAAWKFKLPDALHLATAVEHGCGLFLTNDIRLGRFTDLRVDVLS